MRFTVHPPLVAANLLLALAYGVCGWLALQLAVPPGYAVPAFPPAGIALSALLIFGPRLWVGVFVGSFAVQVLAGWTVGTTDLSTSVLLLVPAGATLQAVFGYWLAQRLIGFPSPLDTPRAIILFLGVVAPISALISPSIAVPLLYAGGLISSGELLFNWWNWWLGDTLGIIVAAPLMFVFLGKPASDWRGRRLGVSLPLLIAMAIVALAFRQVIAWEDMRIQTQFNRDTEHLASQVRKRLDAQLDIMFSVKGLMSVSDNVSRDEFAAFITPWLDRYPGTQNFGWSPLVTHADRERVEAEAAQLGLPGFRILDRNPEGHTYPAQVADEYFPIVYVEPLDTNTSVLGLNPLSLPATAAAITTTRATRKPVTTQSFRLVQERGSQKGVVIYLSATRSASHRPGSSLIETAPEGVISAVFRMDDALAGALDSASTAVIDLCLIDLAGTTGNQRLSGPQGCEQASWLQGHVQRRVAIQFAERPWEMRMRASNAYLFALRSWAVWGTFAAGLLAIGLLGAFLLITSGNARRIAALVERRTHELENANTKVLEKQAALTEALRIARMGSWETINGRSGLRCSNELHQLLDCDERALNSLDDIVRAFSHPDRAVLTQQLEALVAAPGHAVLDCRTDSIAPHTLEMHIESAWRNGKLSQLRGTVQDVTGAREAEAHIQYLAHFDTLTGLPNRSAWTKRATETLKTAARHSDLVAVLFLDLDNFKTINDSLGHPFGDRLLATIARRLSGCVRAEDQLARLGGDEFVALLPRLDQAEDAANIAAKMLEMLREPVRIDEHELQPSVSIGIALFPDDGDSVELLLKHADTAMYGAKASGRDTFQFFVPEMNLRATERLLLENALRRAVSSDELTLHYQPQIDTRNSGLIGCEALVRWQHPQRGLISPAQFIPIAEDSGLIVPLGNWVLREACRQQVEWQAKGLGPITIAVNISALQFQRPDFNLTVANILRETGAAPASIELEITESALMNPGESLATRLKELVQMGLTLSLDDFGTGYSCLAYLKRLPLARLKIDQSFVADLPGDAEDAAVVSAALSLARDLGMEVVAEGVETAAQREFLVDRNCTLMQGYLFSKPLDASAFECWAQESRQRQDAADSALT